MNQTMTPSVQVAPAPPRKFGAWWGDWVAVACGALAAFGAGFVLVDTFAVAVAIIVAGLVVAAYFAPTFVAVGRCHHNIGTITVVNLFLGWTFIGWVIALAMAASAVRPPEGGRFVS